MNQWVIRFIVVNRKVIRCSVINVNTYTEYYGDNIIGFKNRRCNLDKIYNNFGTVERILISLFNDEDALKMLAANYQDIKDKNYIEVMKNVGLEEYLI